MTIETAGHAGDYFVWTGQPPLQNLESKSPRRMVTVPSCLSDLGHQLKSAGRRRHYLYLTVTWVRFLPQEQHPY